MKRYDWDALSAEGRVGLLERPALADGVTLQREVAAIVQGVRRGGDAALMALTRELDGIDLSNLSVSEQEFEEAESLLEKADRAAIRAAAANINLFHKAQLPETVSV